MQAHLTISSEIEPSLVFIIIKIKQINHHNLVDSQVLCDTVQWKRAVVGIPYCRLEAENIFLHITKAKVLKKPLNIINNCLGSLNTNNLFT